MFYKLKLIFLICVQGKKPQNQSLSSFAHDFLDLLKGSSTVLGVELLNFVAYRYNLLTPRQKTS